MKNNDEDKLSPEQIENWRRVLTMQIGPYALIMSAEEIQRHKNSMQRRINEMSEKRGS